ncbi:MAG: spore coat protein [Bacilli bacterium]
MNNQIKNPKMEVPKGMNLNEKDYLNSLLSCLKDMEKNYTIAMTEASCESLYQQHLETFLRIADLQRETYELMFQMGWYILEKADRKKIQDEYSTLNQEFTDLKS